jgi:5'-phosphate synthase pdxT subunit
MVVLERGDGATGRRAEDKVAPSPLRPVSSSDAPQPALSLPKEPALSLPKDPTPEDYSDLTIGVLALQGAFIEHVRAFEALGAGVREVRVPADLDGLDGLVLPGGESTTIGKLLADYGLLEPLRAWAQDGRPLYGTCAGAILLARDIGGLDQPLIGVLDAKVERNAFGRQLQSFEADLEVPRLGGEPFHAVFIRAPAIRSVGSEVENLAALPDGTTVAAAQGPVLVTCFHPELTTDHRFHRHFLEIVREAKRLQRT